MRDAAHHDDLAPETIESALNALDANVSREEWWRIAAALKSELGEAGWSLFEDWSRTGDNFDARDCRDTWKSTRDGGGVNIATLIWKAQQVGWRFDTDRPRLDQDAIAKRRAERDAERRAAEADLRRQQGEAAKLANLTWQEATPASDAHPYLQGKGVRAHGLAIGRWPLFRKDGAEIWRCVDDALLVPIMDARDGKIVSLQGIIFGDDGELQKRYLRNGRKRGGFMMIGTPPEAGGAIVLCEGYATGASIHQLTGWSVVVCFDAPNLPVVAEIMREKFAQAAFIVAADNDAWTKAGDIDNPGVHYARRAADACRGALVVPQFADTSARPTDFNDLVRLEGETAARAQLLANPVAGTLAANDNIAPGSDLATTGRDVDYFTPLPDVGGKGKPLATIENLGEIIDRLGIIARYNVIAKNQELIVPGEGYLVDNRDNDAFARLESECAKFGMPIGNLSGFVGHIAGQNAFNPVAQWITGKPWDGTPRMQALLDTITPVDDRRLPDGRSLKEVLMRRWMMSAIAAAFSPDGVSAHGILVFQGPQYLGKTMWFKQLVPDHLGVLQDGMMLNPADRDSVKQAVSFWMVELGELDATFRKSDLAALKSFVTRKQDVLRLPYARKDSTFARRTVFFGSVNPREFLHDVTGNRRYWTIECAAIDLEGQRQLDMQQVWGEALALYEGGESHFLTADEMAALNANNQEFQAVDPIKERLQTRLVWGAPEEQWTWRTATEILIAVGVDRPTNGDTQKASHIMRELNGSPRRSSKGRNQLFCPPRCGAEAWTDDRPF